MDGDLYITANDLMKLSEGYPITCNERIHIKPTQKTMKQAKKILAHKQLLERYEPVLQDTCCYESSYILVMVRRRRTRKNA